MKIITIIFISITFCVYSYFSTQLNKAQNEIEKQKRIVEEYKQNISELAYKQASADIKYDTGKIYIQGIPVKPINGYPHELKPIFLGDTVKLVDGVDVKEIYTEKYNETIFKHYQTKEKLDRANN